MEDARRGLGVIMPQRGIADDLFDAAADAREIALMPPSQRLVLLARASARVECVRTQLDIGDGAEYTGFWSMHFRQGLKNRIKSLEHVCQRLIDAGLDSLLDTFRVIAEMTRVCEHSFAVARFVAGAMPSAMAFLAALGRTNLIQLLSSGGGASGRQFGSIRSLKRKHSVYGDDTDAGARRMLPTVLGRYAGMHLDKLPVRYARIRRAARRGAYPEFHRDVAVLQGFIDLCARVVRQANPRHSHGAVGRAGTPPNHLRALTSESLVDSVGSIAADLASFDEAAADAAEASAAAAAAARAARAAAQAQAAEPASDSESGDSTDSVRVRGAAAQPRSALGGGPRHMQQLYSRATMAEQGPAAVPDSMTA